ncbi:hypothetical protein BKA64DRAFT_663843 [Cadophora sp. MPI-SDFR-AT-0126]|nr:hypothetical protein BKA64DRAFT_663843 [Leotiomycetes sp. MPI-SDFR-AT-0126]
MLPRAAALSPLSSCSSLLFGTSAAPRSNYPSEQLSQHTTAEMGLFFSFSFSLALTIFSNHQHQNSGDRQENG